MLKSLVVGVSGSPCSQEAMKLAIQWGRANAAKAIGVGVLDDERLVPPESVPLGGAHFKAERDQIVLSGAQHRLSRVLKEFEIACQTAGVTHKTFANHGHAADRLTEHAQRADLLVVGRKRLESTESIAPTTDTLETIIKRAVRPVVCVSGPPTGQGTSVMVAYDGSAQAARTLAAFVGLGLFADLAIQLITVEKSLGDLAFDATLAADFLGSHGYQVEVNCFTSNETPSEALLRHMNETQPALVVLGAYGKSWIGEFFLGSVTKTLLRQSNVPLFLYH